MKDIPMFTSEYGVASLFLAEIPYTGIARVKLQATQDPEALLEECLQFCRACGALEVHASGHESLARFPFVTAVVEMSRSMPMEETDAALFPALPETIGKWRQLYNERIQGVPNAATMTQAREKAYLEAGDCYFIHREGRLLGIGKAAGDTVEFLAATEPGAGKDVLLALASLITQDRIRLTVATENQRAMALYERLGFVQTRELSRWYRIF